MDTNTNSYAENMRRLTNSIKDVLVVADAVNSAVSGVDEIVDSENNVKYISGSNIQNRLSRVENTVAKFTQGKGIVETDDGTYRRISVETVSRPPVTISGLPSVENFTINPNWFFELLQYPRCIVNIDLYGKIEDDSDRAYVNRIIIDAKQENMTDELKGSILQSQSGYNEIIKFLNDNAIEYKEDRDEVRLPLTYEKYMGSFQVIGTSIIKNTTTGINENWYYLSTITYSTVDEDGTVKNTDNVLTIGDLLRFENSVYKVKDIDQTEKRICIEYGVGYENIGLYDNFEYYNDPFSEKIISVGIGIDEIDIVYVKGVNERYNLLSREWSNPIVFYTNDLKYEKNQTQTFESYYRDNVADFGKRWIAEAKEGRLPAYGNLQPNAPTLFAEDLRVVQINTQLNATLSNEDYLKITSDIATTKSNISSTRTTIAANKDKLIKETNPDFRENIQNKINTDTNKVNTLTTQLGTLVEELDTLLNEAGAIGYSPKYHIRGFFAIPDPKYSVDNGTEKLGKQSVIGFETMYRYLHVNETGAALNTFDYNDSSTGLKITGTFSDWNLSVSPFLEKKYDSESDSYYWSEEKVDGTTVAINQIDIPIRSGEKVEMKVRSISEAGYPYSPLKSEWSNSVIISFPDNLTSSDSVTKILETVKSDMTSVVLQETLSSAGVYAHMADSNSQYKHNAKNIEYIETITDVSTGLVTGTQTISVDEKIRGMMNVITNIATAMGYEIDASGNVVGVGKPQTASLHYAYKDGNTLAEYSGRVDLTMPSSSKEEKQAASQKLFEFMDSSLLPSMGSHLASNNP